ncbi:MAG: hypothetical protein L0220_19765 [Acidobacteria bacterium]|nr:hypothetical protein [Acidobacteriota bacterium]
MDMPTEYAAIHYRLYRRDVKGAAWDEDVGFHSVSILESYSACGLPMKAIFSGAIEKRRDVLAAKARRLYQGCREVSMHAL